LRCSTQARAETRSPWQKSPTSLEDLLALFERMGPSVLKFGAVEQAEQTLKQIPPRPMRLKNGNRTQD
jgi:hypothetical protein